MRCEAVMDFFDGTRTPSGAEQREVLDHLAACDDCSCAWAAIEALEEDRGLLIRVPSEGAASTAELAGLWSEYCSSMKPLTGSTWTSCERKRSCRGRLAVTASRSRSMASSSRPISIPERTRSCPVLDSRSWMSGVVNDALLPARARRSRENSAVERAPGTRG